MKKIENYNILLKEIGRNIAKHRTQKKIIVKETNKVGRFGKIEKEVEKAYTQKMLADDLEISERTLIRIENGEVPNLTLETLLNISNILNVNLCNFLEGTSYFTANISSETERELQSIKNPALKNLIEKIIHNLYCDSCIHNDLFKQGLKKELDYNEKILLIKTIANLL